MFLSKVRRINLIKEAQLTHYNQSVLNCSMTRCWDDCINKSDYLSGRQRVEDFNKANRWKKRGLAAIPTKFGISFTQKSMNQVGYV